MTKSGKNLSFQLFAILVSLVFLVSYLFFGGVNVILALILLSMFGFCSILVVFNSLRLVCVEQSFEMKVVHVLIIIVMLSLHAFLAIGFINAIRNAKSVIGWSGSPIFLASPLMERLKAHQGASDLGEPERNCDSLFTLNKLEESGELNRFASIGRPTRTQIQVPTPQHSRVTRLSQLLIPKPLPPT
jgi:hypothetical protein